jgi:hypothetical protein
MQEDCRARRKARSVLVLQSLGFTNVVSISYVYNLNLFMVISWILLSRSGFSLSSVQRVSTLSTKPCIVDVQLIL